jgi:hypothetical protein
MQSKSPNPTLKPQDFEVNKTWLVFRANRHPLQSEDGEIDVFILQDAASLYILGNVFAPAGSNLPNSESAAALLKQAWAVRQEWPEELLLAEPVEPENGFIRAAEWNGLAVRTMAEKHLRFFVEDVRTSYEEFLSRGDDSDA